MVLQPDLDGRIPLHYAAQNNHLAVCQVFVALNLINTITRCAVGLFPLSSLKVSHNDIILFFLGQGSLILSQCFNASVDRRQSKSFEIIPATQQSFRHRNQGRIDLVASVFNACLKNNANPAKVVGMILLIMNT